MIPLITEEVINKGWADPLELLDYIAVAESTPGPFSINTATFIGMKQVGVIGAAAAVLGLILPSFIIILIIAKYLTGFLEYKGVQAALYGLSPAVIGLMASAVISIALAAFNLNFTGFTEIWEAVKNINILGVIIFAVILASSKFFKLNTYKIIILSAVLGIAFYTANDFLGIF
jgi:chromate transporter